MPVLAALALLFASFTSPRPQEAPAPAAEVPALRRVLVLGASLSHGYGLEKEAGARIALADVVDASILAAHEPVRSKTSLLFFVGPMPTGKAQVAAGAAEDPTLVVGLDYLFWYAYGFFPREDERLAMLEKGLAELEVFACPLLVGDAPDVGDATRVPAIGTQPAREGLLDPDQVPAVKVRAKINARIRAWAAAKKNVVVVPLSELVESRHADEDLVIHGNRWPKSALSGLVQDDRLHPTLEGTIALWLGSLDALVSGNSEIPVSAFDWDAGRISRRLHAIADARHTPKKQEGAAVGDER